MTDSVHLMSVVQKLFDSGCSLVIIEHNMDVISQADWIVDLGPEGGDTRGKIVTEGVPKAIIAKRKFSHTGKHLYRHIQQ